MKAEGDWALFSAGALNVSPAVTGSILRGFQARGVAGLQRPVELDLDYTVPTSPPDPALISFDSTPQILCGPAGRGQYNYEAPCSRLTGPCLDLASPTRGRIMAAYSLSADLASSGRNSVL